MSNKIFKMKVRFLPQRTQGFKVKNKIRMKKIYINHIEHRGLKRRLKIKQIKPQRTRRTERRKLFNKRINHRAHREKNRKVELQIF